MNKSIRLIFEQTERVSFARFKAATRFVYNQFK